MLLLSTPKQVAQPDMSYARLGLLQVRQRSDATSKAAHGARIKSISVLFGALLLSACIPILTARSLGLQGLAGGLMLSISFIDLLPQSIQVGA